MNLKAVNLFTITCGMIFASLFGDAPQGQIKAVARADIHGLKEGSKILGEARFEEVENGVRVNAKLSNVAPQGKHGFHIHEFGALGNDGKAAGDHFNPDHHPHGDIIKQGIQSVHAGDLGNIVIDANGNGTIEYFIPGLTISGGKYSIAGRSIILHEKEDDFTQPLGNAGARIGGGTIYMISK